MRKIAPLVFILVVAVLLGWRLSTLPPRAAIHVSKWFGFQNYFASTFPPGTPQADLEADLKRQGYRVRDYCDRQGDCRKIGQYEGFLFPIWFCNWSWWVVWTADKSGNIASLETKSGESGCL